MTTTYEIDTAQLKALLPLFVRAEDALARLDERALRSSIASGFSERRHFFDAIGAMWVAGELVHLEDLVLHDAHMDVRAPSHELTIAHAILRARRRIWTSEAPWALSDAGISVLTGIGGEQDRAPESKSAYPDHDEDDHEPDALLTAELAEIDAVLARSSRLLDDLARGSPQVVVAPLEPSPDQNQDRLGLFDDENGMRPHACASGTASLPSPMNCHQRSVRPCCLTHGSRSNRCGASTGWAACWSLVISGSAARSPRICFHSSQASRPFATNDGVPGSA
jgi:hypothetical protein